MSLRFTVHMNGELQVDPMSPFFSTLRRGVDLFFNHIGGDFVTEGYVSHIFHRG